MIPGEIYLYVRKSRVRGLAVAPLRCQVIRVNENKTVTIKFIDRFVSGREWSQVVAKNLVPISKENAPLALNYEELIPEHGPNFKIIGEAYGNNI